MSSPPRTRPALQLSGLRWVRVSSSAIVNRGVHTRANQGSPQPASPLLAHKQPWLRQVFPDEQPPPPLLPLTDPPRTNTSSTVHPPSHTLRRPHLHCPCTTLNPNSAIRRLGDHLSEHETACSELRPWPRSAPGPTPHGGQHGPPTHFRTHRLRHRQGHWWFVF